MNLQTCFRHAAALLSGVLLLSGIPLMNGSAEAAPPGAIGSVSARGGNPTFYYDTRDSGGATAMWNAAVAAGNATVTLYADWTSSSGTQLVGKGTGAVYDGVIYVPTGCEITIDLNGYNIDRALAVSIENGEVICIQDGGVLNLTDAQSSTSGNSGSITGGFSTDDCGGILVEAGGTLNIWGGSVSGNSCDGSGGGILLAGADSALYMTGGSVSNNKAGCNGGGIASVDGSIRIIQGEFSGNKAAISGGGMYLQGGSAELAGGSIEGNSAATGGGICTSSEAMLSLKGTPSIQRNKAVTEEGGSAGGGILAMSARPIRLSGSPLVTMNTNADGTQSNLMFWMDKDRVYTGRIEDAGLAPDARISVSFTGGKDRDMIMAAEWNGANVFSADTADFTMFEKNGNLMLRRPPQNRGLAIFGIVAVAVIAVALVIVLVISIVKQNRRNQKRKKKRRAV